MHAIHLAKVAYAVAKEANVAAKVRTEFIMAKKSWGEMRIVSIGVAEVLSPTESIGTEGT